MTHVTRVTWVLGTLTVVAVGPMGTQMANSCYPNFAMPTRRAQTVAEAVPMSLLSSLVGKRRVAAVAYGRCWLWHLRAAQDHR